MDMPGEKENRAAGADAQDHPLRLSAWMWHPWYAKAWWIAAVIFWSSYVLLTAFWHLASPADTGWGYLLMAIFHPYLIAPVLGFGYGRALFKRACAESWKGGGGTRARDAGSRQPWPDPIFEHRSIMDPTNPTAIWNPANPISPMWRDEHLFRKN